MHAGKEGMFINLEAEHTTKSTSDSDAKWYNPMSWNDTVISVTHTSYPGCTLQFNFSQYQDGMAMLNVLKEKNIRPSPAAAMIRNITAAMPFPM